MSDDYEISISRTPDGNQVVTTDENILLETDYLVNDPDEFEKPIFIHLDVIHDGTKFSLWISDSQDRLGDPDLESEIKENKREEIIEAIKKLQTKQ